PPRTSPPSPCRRSRLPRPTGHQPAPQRQRVATNVSSLSRFTRHLSKTAENRRPGAPEPRLRRGHTMPSRIVKWAILSILGVGAPWWAHPPALPPGAAPSVAISPGSFDTDSPFVEVFIRWSSPDGVEATTRQIFVDGGEQELSSWSVSSTAPDGSFEIRQRRLFIANTHLTRVVARVTDAQGATD